MPGDYKYHQSTAICPFYQGDVRRKDGTFAIYCESHNRVCCPNRQAFSDYQKAYCNSAYLQCTVADMLIKHHEGEERWTKS